jgi:hypothetical protein
LIHLAAAAAEQTQQHEAFGPTQKANKSDHAAAEGIDNGRMAATDCANFALSVWTNKPMQPHDHRTGRSSEGNSCLKARLKNALEVKTSTPLPELLCITCIELLILNVSSMSCVSTPISVANVASSDCTVSSKYKGYLFK